MTWRKSLPCGSFATRSFFGGVDMEVFDFIGLHENYSEDMRTLASLLEIPISELRENTNTYPNYRDEVEAVKTDTKLMNKLNNLLVDDIRFYDRIVRRRETRSLDTARSGRPREIFPIDARRARTA